MVEFLADPSVIDAINEGFMLPPDSLIEQLEEEAEAQAPADMTHEQRLAFISNYVRTYL